MAAVSKRHRQGRRMVPRPQAGRDHRSAGDRRAPRPSYDPRLAAIGLVGAELTDTVVLTGWTPWGPLPRPNAFFPYEAEAERTKDWAIHCHASQVLLTDYTEFCSQLGRAYAALTREWTGGHSISAGRSREGERYVGVELFEIESYDLDRSAHHDPIQTALGILQKKLDPATTAVGV